MKDVLVGGLDVTLIGEDKQRPGSEVLLAVIAHGRTRSKQTTRKFAQLLSESVPNLVCAVWDLPNHGARLVSEHANGAWDDGNMLHAVQIQAIIDQGAAEAASILTYTPLYIPDQKIIAKVMIGTSLGGYIAWRVAADYPALVTAAIPIISSPNLQHIMVTRWKQYRSHQDSVNDETEKTAFPESLLAIMKRNTEKAFALRNSPLPILAICGAEDPLVPPQCTIDWGQSSQANHRVEIVPGVKHEVPREMIDLTSEYLISLITRVESD